MADRLKDKVAIITGATSGIGRATAVLFVKEGAKVIFAGRREANGKELEQELKALCGEAIFVRTDVSKNEDLDALVKTAIEAFGRIDILVNNAGVCPSGSFTEMDEKKGYDETFDVNVKSYFMLTQKVLPHMLGRKYGSIVNISSIGGINGVPGLVSYSASKGAVRMFSRALALEYAKSGVRVNCVFPGLTNTEMVPVGSPFEQNALKTHPMGRAARPEEIAAGILFFASDDASFCVGSELWIDGGDTAK